MSRDSLFPYFLTKCENEFCPCDDKNSELSKDFYDELSKETENEYDELINDQVILKEKSFKKLSLWKTILQESEEKFALLYKWQKENKQSDPEKELNKEDTPAKYLNDKIFPILLPIMKQMLIEACQWNALENPRSLFNGVDYLAEHLWNKNPHHPERNHNYLKLFDIPPFKLWLQKHPRPIYPKSWQWTEEQAVLYIQRYVRGWLVRKRKDVEEMRLFWKALATENTVNKTKLSTESIDKYQTAITSLTPKNMDEFDIYDRYKLLTELYLNSRRKT